MAFEEALEELAATVPRHIPYVRASKRTSPSAVYHGGANKRPQKKLFFHPSYLPLPHAKKITLNGHLQKILYCANEN